jgi:hypothetical protein
MHESLILIEYRFEFAEIFDYEIADYVVSGSIDTADQKRIFELTQKFSTDVVGIPVV